MKTSRRRRKIHLGVDNPFFPRARKAEERLRAQGPPPEDVEQRAIWQYIPGESTPPTGTPPVEHPGNMRPGYQPSYQQDPGQWFDVHHYWAIVDHTRRQPGYAERPFIVTPLTQPTKDQDHALGEIVQFFGIPSSAFQDLSVEQAWTRVIGPMFEEFELIMNRERPTYIPGMLRFDMSPDHELLVVYYER